MIATAEELGPVGEELVELVGEVMSVAAFEAGDDNPSVSSGNNKVPLLRGVARTAEFDAGQ